MDGVALMPPMVPDYLSLIEDRLTETLNAASSIVAARAPPQPEDGDEHEAEGRGRSAPPPPEDPPPSDALLQLRALTKPKALPSAKGSKILHNDSSERLLPM